MKYQHVEAGGGPDEMSSPTNLTSPAAALSRLRHRLEVHLLPTSSSLHPCLLLTFSSPPPCLHLSSSQPPPQVRKDDVQTVVPISKSWSLMNTAVLTGRQV